MWEVDPETRSKLLILQKREGNNTCCDCGAPSPQWVRGLPSTPRAFPSPPPLLIIIISPPLTPNSKNKASPKFGIFICLNCAGTHRGLGVHISFVRSVSMDAFKVVEMARMDQGGNAAWRRFFDEQRQKSWDECSIAERYGGDVGEEYRDRLSALVEGREYVPVEKKKKKEGMNEKAQGNSTGNSNNSSSGGSSIGKGRSPSPPAAAAAAAAGGTNRKAQNEAYFARLGAQNASRSTTLPPNQGGKFTGFGSDPASASSSSSSAREGTGSNSNNTATTSMPGINDFQRDPVAALTKGFGWFSSAVGKSAKSVNEQWVQPAAQKIAESDLTHQAHQHAAQLGQNIQSGTRGAAESFNRFVEGPGPKDKDRDNAPLDEDKKDFWDHFGQSGDAEAGDSGGKPSSSTAIGTAAMRRGH
ncbi:MAG: Zn finger-containing GTPase- Activating Protein for ARF [Peltula sp. TS41687]|nr:MAG: Zn finger-containing GTPase- Activating Protein for ARF [Peltula sp. TS41687]